MVRRFFVAVLFVLMAGFAFASVLSAFFVATGNFFITSAVFLCFCSVTGFLPEAVVPVGFC